MPDEKSLYEEAYPTKSSWAKRGIPESWGGSSGEYLVMKALYELGYSGRFNYQYPLFGGRTARGGTVVDFYIPELNLALMVQSLYFHWSKIEQLTNDRIIRSELEGAGIRVVFLDEEDIANDAVYYVKDAINGIDHSLLISI